MYKYPTTCTSSNTYILFKIHVPHFAGEAKVFFFVCVFFSMGHNSKNGQVVVSFFYMKNQIHINKSHKTDTGYMYLYEGRADNAAYQHDHCVDKRSYQHDRNTRCTAKQYHDLFCIYMY